MDLFSTGEGLLKPRAYVVIANSATTKAQVFIEHLVEQLRRYDN